MMSAPWVHPRTGILWYRKVIPERARHLFDGKREVRRSLRTRNTAEARLRHTQIASEVEARIAAAGRAAHSIDYRELHALAGEWYRRELARCESDPGRSRDWEAVADDYQLDLEAGRTLDRRRRGITADRPDADEDDPATDWLAIRADLSDWLRADMAKADEVAFAHGHHLDPATRNRLYGLVFRNALRLFADMVARADGDYRADRLATFPAVTGAAVHPTVATAEVTFAAIIEAWALERRPNEKSRYTMEKRIGLLAKHLGHPNAARVTADDLKGWRRALADEGRAAATADNYLRDAKTLFIFAAESGLLPANPAANLRVGVGVGKRKRAHEDRRLPFSDGEARLILDKARTQKGADRWLPWLLAFTGARVEEACQAFVGDIREADGIVYLDINADGEGKSVKTAESARRVPLHPALIAEGFLAYVAGLRKLDKRTGKPGRLFPDLKPGPFADYSAAYSKRAGRWLRSLGITDPRKVANHSWRHRFKDVCRDAEIPKDQHDALTGHAGRDVADSYGSGHSLRTLAGAMRRVPLPPGLVVAGYCGSEKL